MCVEEDATSTGAWKEGVSSTGAWGKGGTSMCVMEGA